MCYGLRYVYLYVLGIYCIYVLNQGQVEGFGWFFIVLVVNLNYCIVFFYILG